MKKNYLLVLVFIINSVFLTSCELLEDILKEPPTNTHKQLIGLWRNDSLETNYYENGILTSVNKQSLQGYTFDLKSDDTYILTNPAGEAYLNGTWDLIKLDSTKQILLDAATANERGYTILTVSKHKLVTNRKISTSETSIIEYTFTYTK